MHRLRPAESRDVPAIRELVISGLREHFGNAVWDDARNPDLLDPLGFYQNRVLVCVNEHDHLIGVGALGQISAATAQIVRVSVKPEARRRHVARDLVAALETWAARLGFAEIVVETTADWQGVRRFWVNQGFEFTHLQAGDAYYHKRLPSG